MLEALEALWSWKTKIRKLRTKEGTIYASDIGIARKM
jgi:hypothetical protein